METDFAWLIENNGDLCATYAGKWIAVQDRKVVGVGETATEAANQAREAVGDAEFILEAISEEADVIYGCFPVESSKHTAAR
jgi:hypothetical protein